MTEWTICTAPTCSTRTRLGGPLCALCRRKANAAELAERPIPTFHPTDRNATEAARVRRLLEHLDTMSPEEQMQYCLRLLVKHLPDADDGDGK